MVFYAIATIIFYKEILKNAYLPVAVDQVGGFGKLK